MATASCCRGQPKIIRQLAIVAPGRQLCSTYAGPCTFRSIRFGASHSSTFGFARCFLFLSLSSKKTWSSQSSSFACIWCTEKSIFSTCTLFRAVYPPIAASSVHLFSRPSVSNSSAKALSEPKNADCSNVGRTFSVFGCLSIFHSFSTATTASIVSRIVSSALADHHHDSNS